MIQRLVIPFLSALCLAACTEQQEELNIPFVAVFGEQVLACGSAESTAELSDLRLYVADVQLVANDGSLVDVQLDEDGQWQQANLALLDFENGLGACANGTPATNTALRGTVPAGDYHGLQFTVGVPFERNHADPLQASAPLNDSAMHWHWRAGYKFLRAGIRTVDDGFWIHLGSTGCEGTVRNITGCASPNRVTVKIPEFVPARDTVAIDLAALVADVNLEDSVPTDCSSSPAESACAAPFMVLGLEFASTEITQEQRVFRRKDQ